MDHYQQYFRFTRQGIDRETHRMASRTLVPPLVRALEHLDLEPRATHDVAHLVRFQEARKDRMHLFQIANPAYQSVLNETNFFTLFLYRGDNPVASAGLRLKWIERTLAEELTSLRFYYDDVPGMARERERCIVTAPTARLIEACPVLVSLSLCVDRDQANFAAVPPLMRLLFLWAAVHWRWSWLIGIAERSIARLYTYDIYGFAGAELGVWRNRPSDGYQPDGELPLTEFILMTAPRRHTMATFLRADVCDVGRPLGQPITTTVDAAAA